MTAKTLDKIDRAIFDQRVARFNGHKGPRVGDFVVMPNGEYRRFTHDYRNDIQTTSRGDRVDAGRDSGVSFYLDHNGEMEFSGGLDPALPKAKLVLTDEVRDGHAWFFHHMQARAHNGVEFTVPCRVYRYALEGAERATWLAEIEARATRMREWEAGRVTF